MHGSTGGGTIVIRADGTAATRKEVITLRRGYFKWMPVLCSNDLVHGSWWMVWGSVCSALFAVIPLIQQYESFYHQHDDVLPSQDFKTTWSLLIFSGIFFGFGSLAFVRAFEEPPKRPLFYFYKHFQTDELLGAWLFLIGTLPSIPYAIVYLSQFPSATYVFVLLMALIAVFATLLFVLACYPNEKKHHNVVLPFLIKILGARMFLLKHMSNDWLAGTWFLFWVNAAFTLGAFLLLLGAAAVGGSAEQIFTYLSTFASSGLFLVGSAYFVAGSYPHAQQFYYASGRGQLEIDEKLARKAKLDMEKHLTEDIREHDAQDDSVINPLHSDFDKIDEEKGEKISKKSFLQSLATLSMPKPQTNFADEPLSPKEGRCRVEKYVDRERDEQDHDEDEDDGDGEGRGLVLSPLHEIHRRNSNAEERPFSTKEVIHHLSHKSHKMHDMPVKEKKDMFDMIGAHRAEIGTSFGNSNGGTEMTHSFMLMPVQEDERFDLEKGDEEKDGEDNLDRLVYSSVNDALHEKEQKKEDKENKENENNELPSLSDGVFF